MLFWLYLIIYLIIELYYRQILSIHKSSSLILKCHFFNANCCLQDITTGVAKISLTGGTDNMSQAPHNIRNIRFGVPLGQPPVIEDSLWLGLTDTYCKLPMALTAEKLGAQLKVTREECDEFSLRSQQLWKAGKLKIA